MGRHDASAFGRPLYPVESQVGWEGAPTPCPKDNCVHARLAAGPVKAIENLASTGCVGSAGVQSINWAADRVVP